MWDIIGFVLNAIALYLGIKGVYDMRNIKKKVDQVKKDVEEKL